MDGIRRISIGYVPARPPLPTALPSLDDGYLTLHTELLGDLQVPGAASHRAELEALSVRVRPRTTVIQKKTGRPVQFEITEQMRETVMQRITKVGRRPGE